MSLRTPFDEDPPSLPIFGFEMEISVHRDRHGHRFSVIDLRRKLNEKIFLGGVAEIALHKWCRAEDLCGVDRNQHLVISFVAQEQ